MLHVTSRPRPRTTCGLVNRLCEGNASVAGCCSRNIYHFASTTSRGDIKTYYAGCTRFVLSACRWMLSGSRLNRWLIIQHHAPALRLERLTDLLRVERLTSPIQGGVECTRAQVRASTRSRDTTRTLPHRKAGGTSSRRANIFRKPTKVSH